MNKKVVFSPDHYFNCPICGQVCREETQDGWNSSIRVSGKVTNFLCYNPLAQDPLHYYSHIVNNSEPNKIAYQEFSVDLGKRSVIFAINCNSQVSIIKDNSDAEPLELNFVIVPDFPSLYSLKKKIRTAITFG